MNDTSRQILSTNKSISTQVAKFCRLTSRFCKILSIKTLFKQKQGIKYTLFQIPKSLDSPEIFAKNIRNSAESIKILHFPPRCEHFRHSSP